MKKKHYYKAPKLESLFHDKKDMELRHVLIVL